MTTISRHRIRIAPDIKIHTPVNDLITSAAPIIWRGTSIQVEVGLFYNGALKTDISNITSLYLEIHAASRSGGPLIQKSIAAAQLVGTLTASDWATTAEDKYHALFELDYADTQLPMDSDTLQQKRTFWLVIYAVTNTSARRLTWGGCNLEVEEDGVQNDLATVPMAAPTFRVTNGDLQLYNKTTGKFHPIWFEGVEGQEVIKYGAGQL